MVKFVKACGSGDALTPQELQHGKHGKRTEACPIVKRSKGLELWSRTTESPWAGKHLTSPPQQDIGSDGENDSWQLSEGETLEKKDIGSIPSLSGHLKDGKRR